MTERERVAAGGGVAEPVEREIVAAAAARASWHGRSGRTHNGHRMWQRLASWASIGRLVIAADLEGVCLATGTACASGSPEPPAVLAALGIDRDQRLGVVRASLGETTTEADVIDEAVGRLGRVFSRLAG